MFFLISKNKDTRFDVSHYKLGWWVNTDQGWLVNQTDNSLLLGKGYCDQHSIQWLLEQNIIPNNLSGNFCLLKITVDRGVEIFNNEYRSFPLWVSSDLLTNFDPLTKDDLQRVWADQAARVSNQGTIHIGTVKKKNKFVPGSKNLDDVVNNIVDLLLHRAEQFKQNYQEKINFYRTGGVDTTLALALCNFSKIDVMHTVGNSLTPTNFITKNHNALKQYWGYKVLHNWNYPNVIVTGSHGDEYFLRGPDAISIITAWHNIDFVELLDKNPGCYHYHHFNSIKNRTKFKNQYNNRHQLQEKYPAWEDLANYILDILINDHQHWHISETITWTPLKEINIANWCLSLPIDELLDNFLNASIPKKCIERLDVNLISSIDQYKNYIVS